MEDLTPEEYIDLAKLSKKVDELKKLVESQKQKIVRLEAKAKEATGKAEAAIVEVGKVRGKKVRTEMIKENKIRNYPGLDEWVEFMKTNFATYGISEVDKKYKQGVLMTTDSMRRELAIRFGNHLMDEKFLTNYTLNKFIRQAGIRTGVMNSWVTTKGLQRISNIILCVKK